MWARILSNLAPKRVIWHACCAQFGTLGTIERCRGTWEHTEGDLGSPGLHFYRFWKDFGAAIWTFLANFGTTIVFFGMRVCRSRFLKILGSEYGRLGLHNQAFGVEGIAKIKQQDVLYAEELGYRIKHIGISRKVDNGIEQRVHPTLIPERRLIANVDGVMNAVLVKSDAVGPTLYYGAGAGAEPTASAVVADIVDVVRALTTDPENRVPHLAFQPDALSDINILPIEEIETAYYLRMHAIDKPGVVADVTKILGDSNISIEAILQKEPQGNASFIPVIFLTDCIKEREMNSAIKKIEKLDAIDGKVMRIRMETFG